MVELTKIPIQFQLDDKLIDAATIRPVRRMSGLPRIATAKRTC